MNINVLKLESKLIGAKVLKLSDWTSVEEIINNEESIINTYSPKYIYCEIDATNLYDIHQLEQFGYRFSEFRIKSSFYTQDAYLRSNSLYPFVAEIITEKKHLKEAIEILLASKDDDRFSKDPMIGKPFSKDRIVSNLKKSFKNYPKEFLIGIFNSHTDDLIAFRSGAMLSKQEALYFQYGISSTKEFNHMASILDAFTIDYLKNNGVQIINAVSTGFNIDELNRLIQDQGFKIMSSHVLMRKVLNQT
jgi:hypothetical protein